MDPQVKDAVHCTADQHLARVVCGGRAAKGRIRALLENQGFQTLA
jgi:hypothetical protein